MDESLAPSIIARVAGELSLAPTQVRSTLALFDEGNTLPFIARYRKEVTGGLDEVQLRDVRERADYLVEMEERRDAVLQSIDSQGKLDDALRAAINAKTASTGVTANVNGSGGLVLKAADGRNISLYSTANAATLTGATAGANLYRGAVRLTSQADVSFSGRTTDLGSASTTTPYTTNLDNSLSVLDITTQDGANTAILSLDAALAQISKVRSDVGALTSRLELTTQALTVSAENQEAAAARIKDADFAYETAQFTRNQILVQAGTAILSQANSTSQIALQLLK